MIVLDFGHSITEDTIKCIVKNAKPTRRSAPRWVVIRDLFGVGSRSAAAICRHFGLDPDEEIKNPHWPEEEL